MSDKLTEEKIEQLILEEIERLNEKTISITDFSDLDKVGRTVTNKKKNPLGSLLDADDYDTLRGAAAPSTTLDDDDFTKAFGFKSGKKLKIAKTIASKSTKNRKKAYQALGYDDGGTPPKAKKKTFKTQSGDIDTTGAIKAKARTPVATGGGLDLDYSAASEASSYISGNKLKAAGGIDPGTIKIVQAEMTKYKSLDILIGLCLHQH